MRPRRPVPPLDSAMQQQERDVRVLVTGASGLIGGALVEALLSEGHEVICAARHPGRAHARRIPLAVDFSSVPGENWWLPHLAGVHAVVNAVGILREHRGQTFPALHTQAPIELFKACARAQVTVVVQVSALGADEAAQSRYHHSKKAADDALRGLAVRAAIVQPSLVYAPGGASAGLFNQLAALPVAALPRGGAMQVQPVHLDDVVGGILALLRDPPAGHTTVAFVGPQPLALRTYLDELRRSLGIAGRLRVVPMPESVFRWAARVAGHIPGSSLDAETAGMLLRGNAAPAEAFSRLLGREPRPPSAFVPAAQAPALRSKAVTGAWLPVLRWAIAFLWIWTGIVSLGVYPVQDSLALLARVGLGGVPAQVALYGAAVLDLALGLLTLAAPARWRRALWVAQLVLIGAYTVLISIYLPEYWLHPYGPISKNLPLMAAIGLLWAMEPAHRKI